MRPRDFLAGVALAVFFLFTVMPGSAQVLNGSIVGDVRDPSGAPIPGATIKISHKETNQIRQTLSGGAGAFSFPAIPTGTYDVSVTHQGFQTFSAKDVAVGLGQVVRVDAAMQVGTIAETVQVSAQAAQLQTDRAEVRGEVTAKSIEDLPVPTNRNYASLLAMVPGFTPPNQQHSVAANPARGMTFNVNGGTRNSNNVRIDGATAVNAWLPHVSAYTPGLEAIQEVSAVTGSSDAEQGLAGAVSVNVQVKSGANDMHGSGFWYHTDNALKAKPFFLPAGQLKPKYIINQAGGTFGGKIIRDKLFYFGSYDGTYDHETGAAFTSVPTAAMKAGNFSGSSAPIYDPRTGNPDGSGRTPFVGNIIPADRQNAIALKMASLIPDPNIPVAIQNNFYANGPYTVTRHVTDAKINWAATSKLNIAGRLGWLRYSMDNPPAFGDHGPPVSSAGGRMGHGSGGTHSTTISATYVAKPTLVFDGYFGWTRINTAVEPPRLDEQLALEFLGIPGTNGPNREDGGYPQFNISNFSLFGNPGSAGGPLYYTLPTWQYVENGHWTKGKHNIAFGVTTSRQHLNNYEINAGVFNFTGGVTTLRGGPSTNAYNSYAQFLLGLTSSVNRSFLLHDRATLRTWSHSFFLRDQWRATSKLTVSIGARWEYFPVSTRADRGIERYDFNTNKLYFCGVGDVPKDCGYEVSKKGVSPRLGLAFRATDTFVIRAGYGLNFDPYPLAFTRDMVGNFPETQSLNINSLDAFTPASMLNQGIPAPVPVSLGNGVIEMPANYSIRSLPDYITRGYVQSWNFTLQKQLRGNFTAQVGYVGSRQVKINQIFNLNYGQVGQGQASGEYFKRFGRTTETAIMTPLGHNQYDSLQAHLERRFSKGLQVTVAYTWSKAIGVCCDDLSDNPPQIVIPQYFHLNRAVLPFDRTHSLVSSVVAELPFGSGKRWAQQGVASKILGGWQTNALFSSYSGRPFTVSAANTSLNAPGSNNQRADVVKEHVEILGWAGPGQSYFDPLAFKAVTEPRFGTSSYDFLRGPGMVNLDFGLFRNFKFRERWTIQFRAEAFNFTNTPHFNNPGANVSNMVQNADGSIRSLGGYTEITSTTGVGREGIDERVFRFAVRIRF